MIKRVLFTLMSAVYCLAGMAQFDGQNSLVRKALVAYSQDGRGLWQKATDVPVEKVGQEGKVYAFVKKTGTVYVQTDVANYEIVLDKETAKIYKSNKVAPEVSAKVAKDMVAQVNAVLAQRYDALNSDRQRELADAAKKAREDSIAQARRDSIQRVLDRNMEIQYRREADWHVIPTRNTPIVCCICGHHATEESIYCLGIDGDSIYYQEQTVGINEDVYPTIHIGLYNRQLNDVAEWQYHTRIFAENLKAPKTLNYDYVVAENERNFAAYLKTLNGLIPYGYVESYGFDIQSGHVVLDFEYTNTTTRGIKSVDVTYQLLDNAGKVLKVDHLRSTTPLEPFHSKKWSWDDAAKVVPAAATDLKIYKVTIFFKDGKQHTVTKDLLIKEN